MTKSQRPQDIMLRLIVGHWLSRLVMVAAELRLADLLKGGPRSVEDLATEANVRAPQLYRALRALASVGVFAETDDKKFETTPLAATLEADAPGSMRVSALLRNSDYQWDAWQELLHGIKTDEVPFVKAHGIPVFEYLEEHPEELDIFHEATTSLTNPAVAESYDFSNYRSVVDLGGGHGAFLSAILDVNPHLQGTLFDQPSVIAGAKQSPYMTAEGIKDRCNLQSGSFFESIPEGHDIYTLKYIIHDWDDEKAVKILSNCRTAMTDDSRVLVVDSVILPGNDQGHAKLLDIEMLVVGGRERTEADFSNVFEKAGLMLNSVIPTKTPLIILEGVKNE
ncbi:MAG: methyltransferase [Alphaproteobacteria bacterium]|nr:methyltransferase [Alphaproteobacteria bacterium]